jgi:hypothetical protein
VTTTFKDLLNYKKDNGRGNRVRRNYLAFYHPEDDDCFWIRYFADWDNEETPPVVMKVYSDGRVWFHPHNSMRDFYKYTIEDKLLTEFVANTWFVMNRNRTERGIRIVRGTYGNCKVLVSACSGGVMFDNKNSVISFAPPRTRKMDEEAIAAYDNMAKEVNTNVKLRAKLDVLTAERDPHAYWHISPEQFYHAVQKANPKRLNSFNQLAFWAQRYTQDGKVPMHEALHKMFINMRPKVLEHIGAVTYT